jgi:hypothetical protein
MIIMINKIHVNQFARVSMRFPANIRASVAGGSSRFTFLPYLWVSKTLVSLLAAHPIAARYGFLINGCTEPIMFSLLSTLTILAFPSQY